MIPKNNAGLNYNQQNDTQQKDA
jgi:hypothetical protein